MAVDAAKNEREAQTAKENAHAKLAGENAKKEKEAQDAAE